MSLRKTLISAAIVASTCVTGSALAAYAMPTTSSVMPNGNWYVNGFGGVAFTTNNTVTAATTGGSEARISFETGYDLGGAVGYRNGPWRFEGQYTYLRASLDKLAGVDISGRAVMHAGMANGFYDFNTLSDNLSPYLGLGIGYARVSGRAGTTPSIDVRHNRFAYQAAAGVGYNVDNSFTVDLGYRYLSTNKPNFFTKRFQNHLVNIGITYHIPA